MNGGILESDEDAHADEEAGAAEEEGGEDGPAEADDDDGEGVEALVAVGGVGDELRAPALVSQQAPVRPVPRRRDEGRPRDRPH